MTEPEVIEKLTKFGNAIGKLKELLENTRKQLKDSQDSSSKLEDNLAELNNSMSEKNKELSDALKSIGELNSKCESLESIIKDKESFIYTEDDLQNKVKELNESFNSSLLGYVKKEQLDSVNESHTTEVSNLSAKITDLENTVSSYKDYVSPEVHKETVSLLDTANETIKELQSKLSTEIESHKNELDELKESNKKAEDDKQTVLSNTWKAQVETEKELAEKVKELESANEQIATIQKDFNEMKSLKDEKQLEIDTLTNDNSVLRKEYDTLKRNSENQIVHLENENKHITEGVKLEMERLNENVKSLESVRDELKSTNSELLDKIKRLENEKAELVAYKNAQTSLQEKESNGSIIGMSLDEANITKETRPFKFGVTTYEVIQKASMFIEGLYNGSQSHDTYTELNNPLAVKGYMDLSDKEYNVFMKRLQLVTYNNSPLIYEFEGRWRTNLSKSRMIEYISTVVENN